MQICHSGSYSLKNDLHTLSNENQENEHLIAKKPLYIVLMILLTVQWIITIIGLVVSAYNFNKLTKQISKYD